MRFSCERCGKRYSTAEAPASGRVYKIRCKACGHLIVVKASAGAPASAATEMRPPTLRGIPAATAAVPDLEADAAGLRFEIAPPEPAERPSPPAPPAPPRPNGSSASAAQLLRDLEEEIAAAPIATAPAKGELRSPPGDAGYVDLFADPPRQEPERTDPFLAAARASLPDLAPGSSGPDPFAPLRKELSATRSPPPQTGHAAKTTPKIPVIPKPSQQRSAVPMMLIGAGALVVVGIVAFVLLGGKSPVAPPPAARAVAQDQASAGPPRPTAAVAPDPALPAPKRPARSEKREQDERRPRERGAREAKTDDEGGLSQAAIEKVLASTKGAFSRCIVTSGRSGEVSLDGRRVLLRLYIQNTGAVSYPALDDVALNGTELGSCLKSAARLMVFPKFAGDTIRIEVPLVLVSR